VRSARNLVTPDEIDLDFVARVVPELEIARVGDEHVVLGGATQLVVLNPTASLIFQFLDGQATLGELAADFTDALGVDRVIAEADMLTFVRDLGTNGLLEGVALVPPELPDDLDSDWTPATPLEVGDELDDFTLPDLDGAARSFSEFRGRRVLLVNWGPGCGFCVTIADELAALDPLLTQRGVDLVLITSGVVATNRALREAHGLTAPTLLRQGTDVDPFRGTGTPAAYLVASDGTLAESMVVGADQVPVLARDLAGLDPTTPFGTESQMDDEDDAAGGEVRGRYLPAPGAMCGPGGGGGAYRTEWQGTRAYALGGYHVGVRYDTEETADVLDRLFAGARVHDRRTPDNYSIALGGTPTTKDAGATRSLKLLVHGSTHLVRSRSAGRALAALLQYVSGDLGEPDASLTAVNATAVLRDGEALLLPSNLVSSVKQLQPRMARAGMVIVDTPRALVDISTRELVVPEPTLPFDPSVIEELDRDLVFGSELPRARPGRYPLSAWFFVHSPEHVGALTPAVAVTGALRLFFELEDLRQAVDELADLFADVAPHGIWYENASDLTEQVSRAL